MSTSRFPRPLLTALALLCPTVASAQTLVDVEYKTVSGVPLHLDLYLPSAPTGPTPLVLWIHGGAWMRGSKALDVGMIQGLLDAKIAVASVDYRLTSQGAVFGAENVVFPAQIDDVQDAILFLRANATNYGLDPRRFGTWGISSGGHLAALAGTMGDANDARGDTSVQAIGDGFGPTDFFSMDVDAAAFGCSTFLVHDDPNSPESILVGFDGPGEGIGVLRDSPNLPEYQLVVAANPMTFLDPSDPPLYAVHGNADCVVSVGQSVRLVDAYLAAGLDARLATHGGGHSLPAASIHEFTAFFIIELDGRFTASPIADQVGGTPWREDFSIASIGYLDDQASPPDFDNETPQVTERLWGGCNMSVTAGALHHAVALDPHPEVSTDGGSLFFNAGALAAGSRAYTRFTAPRDLSNTGELQLLIGKATTVGGTRLRVLLRDAVGWWRSEVVSSPFVAGASSAAPFDIDLQALSWEGIHTASGAGADMDELDVGGETGPLVPTVAGTPAWSSIDGIGFEMAAGNHLQRMFAIDRAVLGAGTGPSPRLAR